MIRFRGQDDREPLHSEHLPQFFATHSRLTQDTSCPDWYHLASVNGDDHLTFYVRVTQLDVASSLTYLPPSVTLEGGDRILAGYPGKPLSHIASPSPDTMARRWREVHHGNIASLIGIVFGRHEYDCANLLCPAFEHSPGNTGSVTDVITGTGERARERPGAKCHSQAANGRNHIHLTLPHAGC